MDYLQLDNLVERLAEMDTVVALVSLGVLTLTITVLILGRTRWGQIQPLRKCLVLSILAHLLLITYTTTIQIVVPTKPRPAKPAIQVLIIEGETLRRPSEAETAVRERPWETLRHDASFQPAPVEVGRAELAEVRQPERRIRATQQGTSGEMVIENHPLADPVQPSPDSLVEVVESPLQPNPTATPIPAPKAQRREVAQSAPSIPTPLGRMTAEVTTPRPTRAARTGLASSLLDRPTPLPRMRQTPSVWETAEAIPGTIDSLSSPAQGQPADWQPLAPAQSTPRSSPNTEVVQRRAPTPVEQFTPPKFSTRDSRSLVGDLVAVGSGAAVIGPPLLRPKRRSESEQEVPEIYRLRMAPDRSRLAQRHGATPETEAAVKAALAWLAANQEPSGRWDAAKHGAGQELLVAGRNRYQAGSHADNGISALALLAFLASGHTHETGLYQETVQRGIDYLLSTQKPDGNLAGDASTYAMMYCHSMASFAVSEAYGMTGDAELRQPVHRAIAYTIAAQDPVSGGWRYAPGDIGDTSQFGWQLMAVKSAELAGIPTPNQVWQRANQYLGSVSFGAHGGLAAYRSVEQVSRPMTAEALVCRQFLGHSPYSAACREAGIDLLAELPGVGEPNFYYWYYGTLGMYQLGGVYWHRWNEALQPALLQRQRSDGPLSGSWDDDTVWGGYGGRVFTTALATLSLEVYYRFLPLYVEAADRGTDARTR